MKDKPKCSTLRRKTKRNMKTPLSKKNERQIKMQDSKKKDKQKYEKPLSEIKERSNTLIRKTKKI